MNASCNFRAASERIVIAGTQTVTLDITTNYNNNNYTLLYYVFAATKRDKSIYISTASLVFSVRCRILQIVRYSIVQAGARFCNMNIF